MKEFQLNEEQLEMASQIYQEAEKGKNYISSLGLDKDIPTFIDFYEGRHWATKISKDTKHIPRLKFNRVKKICDAKITNVLSKKYHLIFRTEDENIATDKFTQFTDFNLKNMRQDRIDYEAVKSGFVKGTWIVHYYWDRNHIGQYGAYEGAINGEVLNPLKVYFSDPKEKDVQKQEYIIYEHEESVKSVRDIVDDERKRSLILKEVTDDNGNIDTNGYITVYTKYFRIDNEVYYQSSTKTVILNDKPKAWNPYKNFVETKNYKLRKKESVELDGLPEDYVIVDGRNYRGPMQYNINANTTRNEDKCIFYPFIVGSFFDRDESIYGISEVDGLKEAQIAINYLYTYTVISAQKQGLPKMVVKKDALKGQIPNNSIDQYLIDYTPSGTDGIKYLKVDPFTAGALNIGPQFIDLLSDTTNSNEMVTSDMITKELSGTAISLLTQNADRNVDLYRKKYWSSLEQLGRILEQFQKHFYKRGTIFSFEISDKVKQALQKTNEEEFINSNGKTPVKKYTNTLQDTFVSDEYKNTSFTLLCEAGEGTQYSEAQTMYMLNNLLQNGLIDQKLYVKLYPITGLPFKGQMLDEIERREQEEVIQLRQEKEQMTAQLQELSNYVKQLETTNRQLNNQLNDALRQTEGIRKEYANQIENIRGAILNAAKAKKDEEQKTQKEKEKDFAQSQSNNKQ